MGNTQAPYGGANSLPPTSGLAYWELRVRGLIGYTEGTLPANSWLLIPVEDQEELSRNEAEQLFAALRTRLFGDLRKPSIASIRRKLHRLTFGERLVLLYGLRYVALRDAHHNRYWPLCLELLFNNQISIDDLRMRLADDLTEQWLAVFEATKGRLFRPQFGKRNIKWPLAHAGLLGRDKALLREFKASLLRRYQQADWEMLLTPELLDDFMSELDDWLSRRVHEADSFLTILRSDERGWITAELAQQFVGQLGANVPAEELGSERNSHARAELMYVPSGNQVELRVTLQFAEPQGLLYVSWEGGSYPCIADASETRYTVRLPLRTPVWADRITITAASEALDLRLRKLPAEPVVFNASTGRRVRTWELGGNYYLLLPARYVRSEHQKAFQLLFPHARLYGQPAGTWDGYSVYWVEVTTLASHAEAGEGRTAVEINHATELLDLPPLDSAWQPRVSLVGGCLLQAGDTPHYDAREAPLLRLHGVWQTPLEAEYQRWNSAARRFETVDRCELPPDEHVQEHLLRYAQGNNPVVARHRVLVDGQSIEWQTRYNTQRFQQQRLAAHVAIYHGDERVQRPSRTTLGEHTLVIQAWPYAEVVLRGQAVTSAVQQMVRLDADGMARLPINETVLAQLPHEALQLVVLWNGLPLCAPLECHASSAMMASDLLVSYRDDQSDVLEIVGQLRDVVPATWVLILVVGAQPWSNQLWQKRQRVLSDGSIELALPVDRRSARWVLVCTQHGTAAPQGVLLHALPTSQRRIPQHEPKHDGAGSAQWQRCLPFFDTVPLPDELRHLVRLTRVDEFRRHPALAGRRAAAWTALTTAADCKRVADWRALGVDVPVALCTWTPSRANFNRTALFLTPAQLSACPELFRRASVRVDVDVRHPNGVRSAWHGGVLVSEDDEGTAVLRLQSSDVLYDCSDCRVALPIHLAHGHVHLALRGHTCQRDNANRSQSLAVRLVAFFDPLDILHRFRQSLQQAIAGQDVTWPEVFSDWLNLLYDCFERSNFAQEERWLEGLAEAIAALLRLLGGGRSRSSAQDPLLVLEYKAALITLMQAIEEL